MVDKTEKIYIGIWIILFAIIMFLVIKETKNDRIIFSQEQYIEKLEKELDYYKNLDSTYISKRDSIVYDIKYRDSTITKIKTKYESEKDSVLISSNNAVVDKFNELVWADL